MTTTIYFVCYHLYEPGNWMFNAGNGISISDTEEL